jgi:hypothetical protein
MYKLIRKKTSSCAPLLDSYSGASAAYSLRKLDADYAGSAIRVRRASDDAESDIGFSGNDLDQSALLSFIGEGAGDDGFIVTWYDQSGNGNNITNATEASQPQIMDEGVIYTVNGKPAAFMDVDQLNPASGLAFNSFTFFTVTQKSSTATTGSILFRDNDDNYAGDDVNDAGNPSMVNSGAAIATSISNTSASGGENAQHLSYYNRNSSTLASGGKNGATNTEATVSNRTFTINNFFAYTALTTYSYAGYVQEIILYGSDKTSDRAGIESNINCYYSVY